MNDGRLFQGGLLLDKNLVDMLRRQAASQPEKIAFTYLIDGERSEDHLTYAELDQRARAIAAHLQGAIGAGERVLLIYPPGLEFIHAFMGCVYAGVIPVPVYPPDPARLDRSLSHLFAIARDAQVCAALTQAELQEFGRHISTATKDLHALQWIGSDALENELADGWRPPDLAPDSLCFIQYTSGSIGDPKGVMVSHYNVLVNLLGMHRGLRSDADSRLVCWLPLYHDLGLIANVLHTIFVGASCTLFSPLAFLQHPVRWLQAITNYRADISMAPNFAYELCVRKTSEGNKGALDLSSWRVAGNGAEPVRLKTLEKFYRVFGECGFRFEAFNPLYGLAESTVAVSCKPTPDAPLRVESGRVSCGKYSWLDQKLVIVDPQNLRSCEEGEEGEIWISSSCVSSGYWNRPAESASVFGAYLDGGVKGPFLRTGDLGFVHDEQLFITGRLKDLIIIRGDNYYPQDIEQTLEMSSSALRPGCGAAFPVEIEGTECLVVAQEVHKEALAGLNADKIMRAIRGAISRDHGLQVHTVLLLPPRGIPKTPNGKVQRRKCREEYLAGGLEVIASDTQAGPPLDPAAGADQAKDFLLQLRAAPAGRQKDLLTEHVRGQVARVLQLPSPDQLNDKQRISELGMDLNAALALRRNLQRSLGCKLRSTIAFDYPTVESLTAYLAQQMLATE